MVNFGIVRPRVFRLTSEAAELMGNRSGAPFPTVTALGVMDATTPGGWREGDWVHLPKVQIARHVVVPYSDIQHIGACGNPVERLAGAAHDPRNRLFSYYKMDAAVAWARTPGNIAIVLTQPELDGAGVPCT